MPNPGLSPEIAQAIARRQGGQPALNQVSPGAATANPVAPPTNPSEIPTSPQVPQAKKPEYAPQSQDDLIVMSLIEQLGRNNKLEKEKMSMAQPQPEPQTPPSPSVPDLAQQSQSPKQQQTNYPF